ncbi:MAG: helix-turn-helix transcriptional regulator [Glutamicibacter ardleyensis]
MGTGGKILGIFSAEIGNFSKVDIGVPEHATMEMASALRVARHRLTAVLRQRSDSIIVVSGKPGVGKQALVSEVLEELGLLETSFSVVGTRFAEKIDYGAIQYLVASLSPEAEQSSSGVYREVRKLFSEAPQRSLIVVDNAHLLDQKTTTVLCQLVLTGDIRLLIMDDQLVKLQTSLSNLMLSPAVSSIEIPVMSTLEIRQVLSDITGARPSSLLVGSLMAVTRGSRELFDVVIRYNIGLHRILVSDGYLVLGEQGLSMDGPVVEIARQRMLELTTDQRTVLAWAKANGGRKIAEIRGAKLDHVDALILLGWLEMDADNSGVVPSAFSFIAMPEGQEPSLAPVATATATGARSSSEYWNDETTRRIFLGQPESALEALTSLVKVSTGHGTETSDNCFEYRHAAFTGAIAVQRGDHELSDRTTAVLISLFDGSTDHRCDSATETCIRHCHDLLVFTLLQSGRWNEALRVIEANENALDPESFSFGQSIKAMLKILGGTRSEEPKEELRSLARQAAIGGSPIPFTLGMNDFGINSLCSPSEPGQLPLPLDSWIFLAHALLSDGYSDKEGCQDSFLRISMFADPLRQRILCLASLLCSLRDGNASAASELIRMTDGDSTDWGKAAREVAFGVQRKAPRQIISGILRLIKLGFGGLVSQQKNLVNSMLSVRDRRNILKMALAMDYLEDTCDLAEFDLRSLLTPRERLVALAAANGQSNLQIAHHTGISVRTVEGHLYQVYNKLEVSGRQELTTMVAKLKIDEGSNVGYTS